MAGKAQEIAGDVSGNERWQAEGVTRQAVGALQEKYGDALSCAGSMMKKNPSPR
ncbi:CsbD family protein [Serratia ureilytica]